VAMAPHTGPVVTRFAPSPTGYLHIGGARTALFCFLFARHHGGQFKLRIEDTDAERHNEEAVTAIVKGMEWLGCNHDGEIVRQSSNKKRHQDVAADLIKEGKAYKCFCTKERLDELRAEAEKNKVPFRYPGTCRDLPQDHVGPAGIDPVVRIKTQTEGHTAWDDEVQGTISFPNKDIDDLIILRGDGSPTYLLAVVVDDHDMAVSHVIRGSDHISNTPRQIAIYEAAGWTPPRFGHIPLIHGADGQKLSKRHGATGCEQYEALGYLPEAMRNYLARLSWSHGNDEIFSTEQAIEWFTLDACSKSPSCFDFAKLQDLNAHYIRECDPARLNALVLKLFPDVEPFKKQFEMATGMLKPRAKTLIEYREAGEFICAKRPITIEEKAAKGVGGANKDVLKEIVELLTAYSGEWTAEALEPVVVKFAEEHAPPLKLGQVAQPLRACLTGSSASPGIYEVMWVVGKEEVIGRCQDAIQGKNPIKEAPKKEEKPAANEGGKEKPKKGGAPAAAAADQPEYTKLEIKVGLLTKTWPHPESEKLFCEEIDVGEANVRSVCSGLRAFYSEAEFCAGKKVAVVTNLKPAKMAGFESCGMVLCAANEDHTKVELLEVPEGAKVGERIMLEGVEGEPLQPNQVAKKNILKNVLPDLKTDGAGLACWQGKPMMTSAGPISAPTMKDSPVG